MSREARNKFFGRKSSAGLGHGHGHGHISKTSKNTKKSILKGLKFLLKFILKNIDFKRKSFKMAKIGSESEKSKNLEKKTFFFDFERAQISIEFRIEKH